MITFFHTASLGHSVKTRLSAGKLVDALEIPERASLLLEAAKISTETVVKPPPLEVGRLGDVHDWAYIRFLETAFAEWKQVFPQGEELRPGLHPNRYCATLPQSFLGRAGYFVGDSASVLLEDTWEAVKWSAASALAATEAVVGGAPAAYALCRPPGHHAFRDMASGYCFLNNAALCATLARQSLERVTIFDVDVHHGNGTQSIFLDRCDVQTISVHADPALNYPFYSGYADETGTGAGEGFNINLPVASQSGDDAYLAAVETGINVMKDFSPDLVVIALGLDPCEADPFACMKVTGGGFSRMGEMLGSVSKPTVIVQEGGYPSARLGGNLSRFLEAFRAASAA